MGIPRCLTDSKAFPVDSATWPSFSACPKKGCGPNKDSTTSVDRYARTPFSVREWDAIRGSPRLKRIHRVAGETMIAFKNVCEGRNQDKRLRGLPENRFVVGLQRPLVRLEVQKRNRYANI